MNILSKNKNRFFLFFFVQIISIMAFAQVKYQTKNDLNILVSGTSTLHDWDMKAAKGECSAVFVFNKLGQVVGITNLIVKIPAEGLKSGHEGMDKNAYKALKTNQNSTISYSLISATINADGTIKCLGKLTIAGSTLNAELIANYKINIDGSISVSGSKKISMKDYNMEPPSFMMGTIKTGNDIILKFDLTIRK